jgi:hypothetical protein
MEMENCCKYSEARDSITSLSDIDEKTKMVVDEFGKQLLMNDEEYEKYEKTRRRYRDAIRSLQK